MLQPSRCAPPGRQSFRNGLPKVCPWLVLSPLPLALWLWQPICPRSPSSHTRWPASPRVTGAATAHLGILRPQHQSSPPQRELGMHWFAVGPIHDSPLCMSAKIPTISTISSCAPISIRCCTGSGPFVYAGKRRRAGLSLMMAVNGAPAASRSENSRPPGVLEAHAAGGRGPVRRRRLDPAICCEPTADGDLHRER